MVNLIKLQSCIRFVSDGKRDQTTNYNLKSGLLGIVNLMKALYLTKFTQGGKTDQNTILTKFAQGGKT